MGISPHHPAIIGAQRRGLVRDTTPVIPPAPPADCSERTFQAAVVRLATACGCRCYHTHDSRRSAAGFPDLVLVRDGVLTFAELKTDTGRVTSEQSEWLESLRAVPGVAVRLWRPNDRAAVVAALTAEGGECQ